MKRSTKKNSGWIVLRGTAVRIMTIFLYLLLTGTFSEMASAQTGYTGIFGGGPFYKNPPSITEIETSGFTEAIVWSVEVSSVGDLNFNGEFPLTSGGVYVGNASYPDFPAQMAQLKQGTVKRVTFAVGSSNYGDWEDITALVQAQGTGPDSILYKDFAALKAAIPALDAIDFDDENSYNAPTSVAFAVMLGKLGYHVMPDPYTKSAYWTSLVSAINAKLPGTVDGVHLQAYSGGAGNSPCEGWNFGTVPVFPGLWDQDDTPAQVQATMTAWHQQCGIIGGFMWLYDDFVGTGLAAQYASAINTAVGNGEFSLAGPTSLSLNQSGEAGAALTITDLNGFSGTVALSLSTLPKGVEGAILGKGNHRKIELRAGPSAATGITTITVTGTAADFTQTLTFTLAVSAAVGATGAGTPVDLSSQFNLYGIYDDGSTYTTGGLDGQGYSYSAKLLSASRVLDGVLFNFGPANDPDAVGSAGQSIALPSGQFGSLIVLGTGVEGSQTAQVLTVQYTDGTTTRIVQSFSDWFDTVSYPRQSEAVVMAYRNFDNGTEDDRTFNLYAYRFSLDATKVVQSITLPNDPDVIVLAATLVPAAANSSQVH